MADAPTTVVETAEFLRKAKPLISDSERADLVAFIGANPDAGESSRILAESGRSAGRYRGWESAAAHV